MTEHERWAYLLGLVARQAQEEANGLGRAAAKNGDNKLLEASMEVAWLARSFRRVCLDLDPKSIRKLDAELSRPMNDA